jgi:hypothetical protein
VISLFKFSLISIAQKNVQITQPLAIFLTRQPAKNCIIFYFIGICKPGLEAKFSRGLAHIKRGVLEETPNFL